MQHSADGGARDKRQRDEHEEREEAQLSVAEPCLVHHEQLGCPEHVLLGSAEHVRLFLAAVEEVKVCRHDRNKMTSIFKRKTAAWCKREAHQLASAHGQVDQAFATAKALSEGIQFELLTSCVHDSQWQPTSDLERRRVIANKVVTAVYNDIFRRQQRQLWGRQSAAPTRVGMYRSTVSLQPSAVFSP